MEAVQIALYNVYKRRIIEYIDDAQSALISGKSFETLSRKCLTEETACRVATMNGVQSWTGVMR